MRITRAQQIQSAIEQQILSGQLGAGSRLPSVRAQARLCGVSAFTVVEAYQRLIGDGWIRGEAGKGYFVTGTRRTPQEALEAPALAQLPIDDDWLLHRIFHAGLQMLPVGCGWLPPDWYDEDILRGALRRVARGREIHTDYGPPMGHAPLRAELAQQLQQQHLRVDAAQLLLSQGASKALDMVAGALAMAGDTVFIDAPGYCNLISCLRYRGFRVVGVPWNDDGPDIDALRALLGHYQPRLFFTNPVLHNPSGASYSGSVAHAVLKLAAEHGFLVVEDQVSLAFHPNPPPCLAALDGLEHTLHIGSFSKTLSPGLRVGYVAARQDRIDALLRYKMMTGLTTPVINEQLALEMLRDPRSRRLTRQLRQRLTDAQAACQQRLQAHGWGLFCQPPSGLFVYARHPAQPDAAALAQSAQTAGLQLAPGHLFMPNDAANPWLRFNVAYCSDPRFAGWLQSPG